MEDTHISVYALCAVVWVRATVGEDICRKRSGAPFDRIMKGVCDCLLLCALLRFFYSFESNTRQHRGAVGIQLSARIPNWMADGLSPIDALMLAGFIRRCVYASYGRAGISDNAQHRRGEKNKKGRRECVVCNSTCYLIIRIAGRWWRSRDNGWEIFRSRTTVSRADSGWNEGST